MRIRLAATASRHGKRFAVCIDNGNYPASLERWKIYGVVTLRRAVDRPSANHALVRRLAGGK